MADAKHTPGPWRYQEESDAYTHIVRAGDRFITQLAQDTSGIAEANARLIAAAPEMAEALREIAEGKGRFSLDQFEHACNTIEDMKALAVAALKKAGL